MAWGMGGKPNRSGNSKLPTGLGCRVPQSRDLSSRRSMQETVAGRQGTMHGLPEVTRQRSCDVGTTESRTVRGCFASGATGDPGRRRWGGRRRDVRSICHGRTPSGFKGGTAVYFIILGVGPVAVIIRDCADEDCGPCSSRQFGGAGQNVWWAGLSCASRRLHRWVRSLSCDPVSRFLMLRRASRRPLTTIDSHVNICMRCFRLSQPGEQTPVRQWNHSRPCSVFSL